MVLLMLIYIFKVVNHVNGVIYMHLSTCNIFFLIFIIIASKFIDVRKYANVANYFSFIAKSSIKAW